MRIIPSVLAKILKVETCTIKKKKKNPWKWYSATVTLGRIHVYAKLVCLFLVNIQIIAFWELKIPWTSFTLKEKKGPILMYI